MRIRFFMAFGYSERSSLQERNCPPSIPCKIRFINKQTIFRQMFLFSKYFHFPQTWKSGERFFEKSCISE